MIIPIQNIYYLLCYAWDKLEEGELIEVDADDTYDLQNLLGSVLLNGTKTLLKRGIDRQYITENQVYQGIKGKVNITDSLRKNLFQKGLAHCEFDELSADILPNQILRTTLQNLVMVSDLFPSLKQDIRMVLYKLSAVNTIHLSDGIFRQVNIHRNNAFYSFLLNICELIYKNLLINEQTGAYQFRDFMRDERQMARLFEAFIRNFYKIEMPEIKVYREDLHWQLTGEDLSFLPKMQTDISIVLSNNQKVIIDTKYYTQTLKTYYNAEKIHAQNMYQLFAYLKNQEDSTAEGILLYPTVQQNLSLSYQYESHRIRIETINLNQHWTTIKNDLLALLYR